MLDVTQHEAECLSMLEAHMGAVVEANGWLDQHQCRADELIVFAATRLGITERELAMRLGVSNTWLSYVKNGRKLSGNKLWCDLHELLEEFSE